MSSAGHAHDVAGSRAWHAQTDYAALGGAHPGFYPRVIVRGRGAYLYDDTGFELLDVGHHLGVCQIGHGRAEMTEAIAAQISELEYSPLLNGLSNEPAATLANRLAEVVPAREPVVFFSSSGSEANELAFKLVRAYHALRGEPSRVKILARAGSYHGWTFGAMSATGMPALREPFAPLVPGFVRCSQPSPGRCGYCDTEDGCTLACANELDRIIRQEGSETIAALIGEPVAIQQAVKVPHPTYWKLVREICSAHDILLIADEIVTGFGRTGRLFGLEHWDVQADLVTMAKGLTSGYIPLGATAVSRHVYEAIETRPFAHINTYAGHPVACVAALTNLEIIQRENLVHQAAVLEDSVRTGFRKLSLNDDNIPRCEVTGLLASIEIPLASSKMALTLVDEWRYRAYQQGLLPRVIPGDQTITIYVYPPLVVTESEISDAFEILQDLLVNIHE